MTGEPNPYTVRPLGAPPFPVCCGVGFAGAIADGPCSLLLIQ